VAKNGTQTFTVAVSGTNNPAQTVIWSVEGGVSGTTITTAGVLTVASNETATTLTVRATSAVDNTKSGTATVTVTTPIPQGTAEVEGTIANAPEGTPVYLYALESSLKSTVPAGYVLVGVVYTDANGNYSFDGLPQGTYIVIVEINGYQSTPSAPVTVTAGQTAGNINFTVGGNTITPNPISVTGVETIVASDLKVYPNPFTDEVRITGATGSTLQVITESGVLVHTQKITGTDESLRLNHLPAGVYFFRLEKDGQTKTL